MAEANTENKEFNLETGIKLLNQQIIDNAAVLNHPSDTTKKANFIVKHPYIELGSSEATINKKILEFQQEHPEAKIYVFINYHPDKSKGKDGESDFERIKQAAEHVYQSTNWEVDGNNNSKAILFYIEFNQEIHVIFDSDTPEGIHKVFNGPESCLVIGKMINENCFDGLFQEDILDIPRFLEEKIEEIILQYKNCSDIISGPTESEFTYNFPFSTSISTYQWYKQLPKDGSNRLSYMVDPNGAQSLYDYSGLIHDEIEQGLLTYLTRSGHGVGDQVDVKWYNTDDNVPITLLNRIKDIAAKPDEILVWNHIDHKTGELKTEYKFGEAIQQKLQEIGQHAGWLKEKLWGGFNELLHLPEKVDWRNLDFSKISSSDKTYMALLFANPIAGQMVAGYWTVKLISHMLKKLEIPPYVYDRADQEFLGLKYPIMYALYPPTSANNFPLMCGIWNGILNEVTGITDLIVLIIDYIVDPQVRGEINQGLSEMWDKGLFKTIWEGLKDSHSGSYDKITEQIGRDFVAVATVFIGVGVVTKAGKLKVVVQITTLTDYAMAFKSLGKFIVRGAGGMITITGKGFKIIYQNGSRQFYKLLDNVDLLVNAEKYLSPAYSGLPGWRAMYSANQYPANGGKVWTIIEKQELPEGTLIRVKPENGDEFLDFVGKQADEVLSSVDYLKRTYNFSDDLAAQISKKIDNFKPEVRLSFFEDLKDADFLAAIKKNGELVDAWSVLKNRPNLKTDIPSLEALNRIRKNTKLGDLKITDDMLSRIEGIPNVSYAQILDDLDVAIKSLPEGKVIDFHKVIADGQRGLVNTNNVWDRRHSWLTLKKIKENETFLKNADEIKFEVELEQIDGIGNAVPDIVITKSGAGGTTKKIIGEVKAGDNVITTNFNSQSLRYFQEIADIRDLRLFRRDGVPLTKQQVIDSWKSGGVLNDAKVKNLFEKFDEDVVKAGFEAETDILEEFLKSDNTWFNTIFNSSF